jgi:hypothetical protein
MRRFIIFILRQIILDDELEKYRDVGTYGTQRGNPVCIHKVRDFNGCHCTRYLGVGEGITLKWIFQESVRM